MRILFIGAERAGKAALGWLEKTEQIVGVVTASLKMADRIADFQPFFCHEIPCWQVDSFQEVPWSEILEQTQPDLILVVSWSGLIPKEVLDYPKLGCVGFHYSLLPERRGGAPVAWAIIDGLERTGVTMLYLTEQLDAGDIIDQREVWIGMNDTPRQVLDHISTEIQAMIRQRIPEIAMGTAPRVAQDLSKGGVTKVRNPRQGELGKLMWQTWDLATLHNFIRALDDPYPGAFLTLGKFRFKFSKSRRTQGRVYAEVLIEEAE